MTRLLSAPRLKDTAVLLPVHLSLRGGLLEGRDADTPVDGMTGSACLLFCISHKLTVAVNLHVFFSAVVLPGSHKGDLLLELSNLLFYPISWIRFLFHAVK